MRRHRLLTACLVGVLVSLLGVGIVSSTLLRHVIQVAPILFVLAAIWRGSPLAPYFAMPVLAVWAVLMVLIWLYLAGVQTFFSGSFSPVEVLLTILIGALSLVGLAASVPSTGMPIRHRAAALGLFVVVQFSALWISFLVANR